MNKVVLLNTLIDAFICSTIHSADIYGVHTVFLQCSRHCSRCMRHTTGQKRESPLFPELTCY